MDHRRSDAYIAVPRPYPKGWDHADMTNGWTKFCERLISSQMIHTLNKTQIMKTNWTATPEEEDAEDNSDE